MRYVAALTLGLLAVMLLPRANFSQGGQMEASRGVTGGGISVSGWTGKIDPKEEAAGLTLNSAKLAKEGNALHVVTGPAVTYWNPANTATGSYTVSATFTEPKYMSSNDHPHPYGLFIGGHKLDTDQASLLYCTPYGNGRFIVRGFGPARFDPMTFGRATPNDAVKKAEPGGSVTQEVAWVVTPEKADCKINGTVVASIPKAELVGTGKLESLDGVVGIRVAHNVDVNVSNFKLTK